MLVVGMWRLVVMLVVIVPAPGCLALCVGVGISVGMGVGGSGIAALSTSCMSLCLACITFLCATRSLLLVLLLQLGEPPLLLWLRSSRCARPTCCSESSLCRDVCARHTRLV